MKETNEKEVETNESEAIKSETFISIPLDTKGSLRLQLSILLGAMKSKDSQLFDAQDRAWIDAITKEERSEIEELIDLLGNIEELSFIPDSNTGYTAKYKVSLPDRKGKDRVRRRFNQLLPNVYISTIISYYFLPKEAKSKKPKEKTGYYKSSGHLFDNLLKYPKPSSKEGKGSQLQLWESLSLGTMQQINKKGVDKKEIYEGLDLTAPETKLIHSLALLLHEKSQTSNPKGVDYYTGNLVPKALEVGTEIKTAPAIACTLYELAKLYKGGEDIGGKDVENVMNVLQSLNNRHFLIIYTETYIANKGNKKLELRREGFHKLIHINKLTATEIEGADSKTILSEKVEIQLHPIFRDQIDTKFIKLAKDIHRRTAIAYGSEAISKEAITLRDYLSRVLSSKKLPKDKEGKYYHEIGVEKLCYTLNANYMEQGRKKKVQEATKKAIETVQNLGMIHGYKVEPGASVDLKYIFYLNRKWKG